MDHVAIMKKSWGLTRKIITREKVIESRWYINRHAPWGKVSPGDIIYFKDSGYPITLKANVTKVLQISHLSPLRVREILAEYGADDGITPSDLDNYYELFKAKKYCMLIFLSNPECVEPFHINKTGFGTMSAWITIPSVESIRKTAHNREGTID